MKETNSDYVRKTIDKNVVRKAFIKSMPIMFSYFFVSMAYGMMMENAGFHWYYSLLASAAVYIGAFQFVLITFLSSGASILTVAVTALLMNSRQIFYSLSFVDEFKKMKKSKLYMIHTLTDETYAVDAALYEKGDEKRALMFLIALFSHCYWIIGTVLGSVAGQLIPFDLEGIDFCMTALFVIIFIDGWERADNHFPAILGMAVSIICLLIFGQTAFMLPSLLLVSGIMLFADEKKGAAGK